MTDIQQCEYEIVPPHEDPSLGTDVSKLIHPDRAMTACAAAEASRNRPRRFIFYTAPEPPFIGQRHITVLYQGFVNHGDGSVVLLHNGHPVGWYRSVASAWHRIRLQNPVWLAWLEPDPATVPADINAAAEREARHCASSTWYVSIPFTAFGREDARMRAADVTGYLETCLSGVDRLDVTFGLGDDPADEDHVFCEETDCLRRPGHPGEHHIPGQARPAPETPNQATSDPGRK